MSNISDMLYISNVDELAMRFNLLHPDEREIFADMMKDWLRAQGFNLNDLITAKEDDGIQCPHCRNIDPKMIARYGVRQGIQRYRCKACSKMFSSTTGSFLSWTKKNFYTWKSFIKSMMEGHSVRKSATVCKIHRNTAFMWRHKILDALAQYQNSQGRMRGVVEVDDTLFRLSYKGSKPPDRESRQRGTPASKPGTSKEQVCVSCAVERNGKVFSKVSALGRTTAKVLKTVFRGRISKRSIICTDKDTALAKFVAGKKCEHVPLNGPTDRKGPYHIQNINSYHSRLREFIRRFKGVATKYLDNYLVYFNFMREGSRSRAELLKLAIKALVFDRWADISNRPAIPIPA